ncbi:MULTISPECIES: hypothetical protein [Bacillaceae]|uniref:Uncharacterized protein n=1 Tax=Evansella alkalicola TaxID=745819 RepID=A0ABS6K257_9BACI|nr:MULTISPECIES: hypothetical protein [Bacillaceae]MBU9724139.1 hypothetical protein [Bacillus alkalicola]
MYIAEYRLSNWNKISNHEHIEDAVKAAQEYIDMGYPMGSVRVVQVMDVEFKSSKKKDMVKQVKEWESKLEKMMLEAWQRNDKELGNEMLKLFEQMIVVKAANTIDDNTYQMIQNKMEKYFRIDKYLKTRYITVEGNIDPDLYERIAEKVATGELLRGGN